MAAASTIGDHLKTLAPSTARRKNPLPWPPDVFALVSSLLLESGAYVALVDAWPPVRSGDRFALDEDPLEWPWRILEVGEEWRQLWLDDEARSTPKKVQEWWRTILSFRSDPLVTVREESALSSALFHLLAAADEASEGVGFPEDEKDFFQSLAEFYLLTERQMGSTLCTDAIDPLRARVLPKQHTPQSGITLRSLSHHLALVDVAEVYTTWNTAALGASLPKEEEKLEAEEADPAPAYLGAEFDTAASLRLLVIPHPSRIQPHQFRPAEPMAGFLGTMPYEYGFFTYHIDGDPKLRLAELEHYFLQALDWCDHVDGVIYPELSLTPEEFRALQSWLSPQGVFLVAGVGEPSEGPQPGSNYVQSHIPVFGSYVPHRQDKHHRWCMDRNQIETYELDGFLSPAKRWWEHAKVEPRNLAFFSLNDWLTFCVLICEDLARQDPVARVVRAVGPNLVIALLMDGPQLKARWPARYATVLAEDPGSSVLTITSVGMAERSRPPGESVSRVVALWKDAQSATREVELPAESGGLLLTLIPHWAQEWAADGRSNFQNASYPLLTGVHPLPRPTCDLDEDGVSSGLSDVPSESA